jgi:hypothetical protein
LFYDITDSSIDSLTEIKKKIEKINKNIICIVIATKSDLKFKNNELSINSFFNNQNIDGWFLVSSKKYQRINLNL